jgi:hypothetical protein
MSTPIDKNMNTDKALLNKDVFMTGISKSALRWVIASLSLILFTTIICLSYSIGVSDAEHGAIPIIRADGSAIKIRPDNPGGRQYPHQDLTIYNSFRDDITQKDTQLKDDVEKPMVSVPSEAEQDIVQNSVQDTTQDATNKILQITDNNPNVNVQPDEVPLTTVSQAPPTPKEFPEPVNSAVTQRPNTPIMEQQPAYNNTMQNADADSEQKIKNIVRIMDSQKPPVVQPTETVIPKPIIEQKPTAPNPIPVAKTNGHYLQIGAYRSDTDALAGFKRAKGKFSVLSNANHHIVKADLGTRGIYYRLRVGPFASKEQSLNFCSKLQSQGQACLYIAN